MNPVDHDMEVLRVLQESGLHFCNPHLEIKLVACMIIAFRFRTTAEVVKIEDSEVVKAGSCANYPRLYAPS